MNLNKGNKRKNVRAGGNALEYKGKKVEYMGKCGN